MTERPAEIVPREASHAYMHGDHVAFYLTDEPKRGQPVRAETAVMPDGEKPENGARIVCGTCDQPLPGPCLQLENVREVP